MQSGTATVRQATRQDLEMILEIYNDAITHTTAVYHYEPYSPEKFEAWWQQKTRQKLPVLVAESGGQVTGFCSYGPFRPHAGYLYTAETSVYVHKDFRGHGFSKMLYAELIKEARKNKIHVLVAGVDARNQTSINLHRKFGFEVAGTLKSVGYKFGQWLDLTFMQLILAHTKDNV
ncbi:MAG: GNAT family N-acetyltransferase [Edaphocola sp.]